jgi:tellurite resistance protein TehA-like permease
VQRAVEGLAPGYFALVMASGIISVGLNLEGYAAISWVLLVIAASAFVVLLSLTAWRFVAYRQAIKDDFNDPRRGFGFFTFVAGTNVLGVRLGTEGFFGATAALLVLSGIVWLVLGYVVPWTAVLGREERPVVATANGTWFIWVVASQSVAVAAATIEPVFETGRRELALLAVMSWSVGVFLYAAAGVFVSLRLMLYKFGPEADSALLGVDGGTGHHGPGGSTHRPDGGCTDGGRDARAHRGPGRRVLGVRDLVDPGPGRGWLVAPRRAASAASLRGDAVEHHLSARYVWRRRDLSG